MTSTTTTQEILILKGLAGVVLLSGIEKAYEVIDIWISKLEAADGIRDLELETGARAFVQDVSDKLDQLAQDDTG